MITQKAFFYRFDKKPGVGIIAKHLYEGWERINLYAFGVDMDAFLKQLEKDCEASLLEEKIIASRPAHSKVIIAGGVVFKGFTCLAGESTEAGTIMDAFEERVEGFETVKVSGMKEVESITPLDIYCFTFGEKVVGISRVVFFEYATQMALAGIYRDQDSELLDGLYGNLSRLKEYMTIPSPLRTDEKDARVELNMFMIRHPLKEELQYDFVNAIIRTPGLSFYII